MVSSYLLRFKEAVMIVGFRVPDFASWSKLLLRGGESLGLEWTPGVRTLTMTSSSSLKMMSKCASSKHLRTVHQRSSCLNNHRSISSAPSALITDIFSAIPHRRIGPNTHGQFRLFHATPLTLNRNSKYSFDPDIGSDSPDFKKRFFTLNEAVVFKHYNEKGRRLPRV